MKCRKILSVVLAAGMLCGSVPFKMPDAKAAEEKLPVLEKEKADTGLTKEKLEENDYVLYTANCGTPDSTVLPSGEKKGLLQSNFDQAYGEDEEAGTVWGCHLPDEYSRAVKSGSNATDIKASFIYMSDKVVFDKEKSALGYSFQIPDEAIEGIEEDTYEVTLGFKHNWDNRNVDIVLEDETFATDVALKKGEWVSKTFLTKVTDGELDVLVKSPRRTSTYGDPILNYIKVRAVEEKESVIPNYTSITGTAGEAMYDMNGIKIQAHGGQVQKLTVNGETKWYWIGEDKSKGYRPCSGIHMYSSTDLYNWKDEGVVLRTMERLGQFETDDYFKNLYADCTEEQKENLFVDLDKNNCVIERPKMLYNEKTGKYVIWFHADGRTAQSSDNYGKAKAGIAISDSPTGPFKLLGSYKLNYHNDPNADFGFDGWSGRGSVRDMNVFKDDDGTAYVIYSSEGNRTTYISKMNDTYTGLAVNPDEAVEDADFTRCFIGESREAPAMFKYRDKYYMINSGCTGWSPNAAKYAVADHPLGPWTLLDNPCVGEGNETTFRTQSTCVIPVDPENGKYIYMGDRWNSNDLKDSRYVWLPIEFQGENKIVIKSYENWTLDELNGKEPFEIVTELPKTAPSVAKIEELLPEKVMITFGKEDILEPVTWEIGTVKEKKIGVVTVTGTLTKYQRTFTHDIYLMDPRMKVFFDCGAETSEYYEVVKAALGDKLLNQSADQKYTQESKAGYLGVTKLENPDKFDLGLRNGKNYLETGWWAASGKNVEYAVDLKAGEYMVSAGFQEWWNTARPMKMTISVNGNKVAEKDFTLQKDDRDLQISEQFVIEEAGTVKISISKTGNADPVLSWLSVVGMDEEEPVINEKLSFESSMLNYVQMERPFEKVPEKMTFTAKLEEMTGKRQIILGNYVDNAASFSIELTTEGYLRYFEWSKPGTKENRIDVKTTTSVCDGEWADYEIIRDVDAQQIRFLKDGNVILEKSAKILEDIPLTTEHYIGTDRRKTYYLNAEISDMALYGAEGLMHSWKFDEKDITYASNIIYDSQENGINGMAYNFDVSDAPVFEGTGTNFADNQTKVELVNNFSEVPLSFETWINMPKSSASSRGGVICGNYYEKYYWAIPHMNVEIYTNGNPRVYWENNGKTFDCVFKDVTVANGKWTHLAITYDPEKHIMSCYVNGQKRAEQEIKNGNTWLVPEKFNQPFKIGRDARETQNLKGSMADLRIWSTVRTEEQIRENLNKELTGTEEGLLGNWKLDKVEGGVYSDISVNHNDAGEFWIDRPIEEGDYSIAVIPDTQELAASYPEKFKAITTWLKENKEKYNIELAIQVGDLVNSNNSSSQWDKARESFEILDGHIPYVFAPGNHDTTGTRDTSMFNSRFPYSKYSETPEFGGAFEEGKMDNTYSFFTIGGMDFMTISLETAPRREVIEWANRIVKENPGKKVIVSTHAYLNYDGTRTNEKSQDQPNYLNNAYTGEQMWDEFVKKHENIVMVLCGHVGFPDIVVTEDVGEHGNKVPQILCDAQFMDRASEGAGLGMVMMMTFKEGSQEVSINWYSTDRDRLFRERNQFTLEVDGISAPVETDKADLAALIEYAQTQKENAEYENVIPVVQKAFEKALTEAGKVNDNACATQEAVDAAYEELLGMVHLLSFIKGETGELQTLVDVVKGMNKEIYTTDSWLAVETALTEAEKVLADENAMQDEIDAARDALQAAKEALVKISVDKTKLQKLADKSKNYEDAIEDYTPATAEIFKGALANARKVLENKEASQEMIDDAYATLQNAIFGLRLIPDKGKLEDSIKSAQAVDIANYTVKSATAFAAALDHAKEVFADENATEKQVEDAERALEEAQKNLVAKADTDATEEAQKVSDKKDNDKVVGDDRNKKETSKSAAKTGDAGIALPAAVAGAAVLVALVSLTKKRRKI